MKVITSPKQTPSVQKQQTQTVDLKQLLGDLISTSQSGKAKKDPSTVRSEIRKKIENLDEVTKNTPAYKALEFILNKKSNDELLDALAQWKKHNY